MLSEKAIQSGFEELKMPFRAASPVVLLLGRYDKIEDNLMTVEYSQRLYLTKSISRAISIANGLQYMHTL
jgi:hypothetical protein